MHAGPFPLVVTFRGSSTVVVSIMNGGEACYRGRAPAAAVPRVLICSSSPRPRPASQAALRSLVFRVLIEHDPNAIKTAAGLLKHLATARSFGLGFGVPESGLCPTWRSMQYIP